MRRFLATNGTNGNPWPSPWVTSSGGGSGTADIQSGKLRLVSPAIGNYGSSTRALLGVPISGDFELRARVTPGQTWATECFLDFGIADTFGGATNLTNNNFAGDLAGSTNQASAFYTIAQTTVGPASTVTFTGSNLVWARLVRVGMYLLLKVWDDGTAEPGAWSSIISCPGPGVGALYPYFCVNTGFTAAARTFSFESITLDDLRTPDPRQLRRALRR